MSCVVIRCAGWTVVGIDSTVRSSRYWCSLALVPLAVVVYAGYKSVSSSDPPRNVNITKLQPSFFFQTPPVSRNHSKNDHSIMFEHQIHPIASPQSSVYHIQKKKQSSFTKSQQQQS